MLQILHLLIVVEQTGLLTLYGLTSLLTLCTLKAFWSLTLLAYITLTGLH